MKTMLRRVILLLALGAAACAHAQELLPGTPPPPHTSTDTMREAPLPLEAPLPTMAEAPTAGTPQGDQEDQLYLDALKALADGRPDEATGKLSRLLEKNTLHAGAWLDLAISHCELGNTDEALRLFAQIETRFQPNQAIRDLIASYRNTGCKGRESLRRTVSLKFGYGYDSNVNQGSSSRLITIGSGSQLSVVELGPDSLPQADHYKTLSADVNQPLGRYGILLLGQLRAIRHDDVTRQDSDSLLVGAERSANLYGWKNRFTGALGAVRLNDQLYQRQAQMLVRTVPPVILPDYLNWSVAASYSRAVYPTREYYNANTFDMSTSLALRGQRASTQVSVGALSDHGRSTRPGGDRQAAYASVNAIGLVSANVLGEMSLTHQRWRSERAYSPGLIDTSRRQNTTQARASLQYLLSPHHSVQLEWRRTWNRENIPLFQYDSHMLQLSWRSDNW